MSKAKKIRITERDKKILHLLFENRMATNWEIRNRFFNEKSRINVAKRLKKLRDAELIGMEKSVNLKRNTFYFIKPLGLKNIYPFVNFSHGIKLKSPNLVHDLTLVKLRNIFNNSEIIHKYYTENMLMLDLDQREIDNIFSYDERFRPDALFITRTNTGKIHNAIEVELSAKSAERYANKIQRYYLNEEISFVLFISNSHSIIKKVIAEEKMLYPEDNPKFYYGDLNFLFQKKLPFIFENFKGVEFELF